MFKLNRTTSKKPKCLTLHEKSLVIQELANGQSVTSLSEKYGVAKSTICKIKQQKEQISIAVRDTYVGTCKRRTLKSSEFPRMEKKIYDWFLAERSKNVAVSGEMIKEKAKLVYSQIGESDKEFSASEGWLQRFKRRFGIRFYKVSKEKSTSQPEVVDPFHDNENPASETGGLPTALAPQGVFEESHELEWNQCDDEFEDKVIEECRIDEVKKEIPEPMEKISIDSAINALDIVTRWAEESEVDIADISVIKRLREKAVMQDIKKEF